MTSLACIVLCAALIGQANNSAPPTAEELSAAGVKLGSDDFAQREAAMEFLWRAGKAAQPALEAAIKSGDAEAATRAKGLLEKIRLGILPTTPPELLESINAFHKGDINQRRRVLHKLRDADQFAMVHTLFRSLDDSKQRKLLAEATRFEAKEILQGALGDDLELLEELLQDRAVVADEHEDSISDYAAFLVTTGRLDNVVKQLRESLEPGDAVPRRLLARLLQVQGKLDEALALFKDGREGMLYRDLLYRAEDWNGLAQLGLMSEESPSERQGMMTAFHYLAGHPREFEAGVTSLLALAEKDENALGQCAIWLMRCDQFEQAAGLYEKSHYPSQALRLRHFLLRDGVSFERLGIADPRRDAVSWFERRIANLKAGADNDKERNRELFLGLEVAEILGDLGERQDAQQLLKVVQGFNVPGLKHSQVALERKLGLHEQARRDAVEILKERKERSVMYSLFPDRGGEAAMWWEFLLDLDPEEDTSHMLQRLTELLREPADERFGPLMERAAEHAQTLKKKEAARWVHAIAELCAKKDEPALARKYFTLQIRLPKDEEHAFVESGPLQSPRLRIGDMYATDKDWLSAAQAYHEAWQANRSNPLPVYLRGYALVQAGHAEEGRRLMERATFAALGSGHWRWHLGQAMQQRGMQREAREQYELLLRVNYMGGSAEDAAQELGNLLEVENPARSAQLWQRFLLDGAFLETESYPLVASEVHRTRGLGLLAEGKKEAALREIELARAARPGGIELVETVVPKLQAAGCAKEADKLFADVYEAHDRVLRDFPNAARYHNDLAWLSARCDRRLDDALAHARRAQELVPESAAYRDTLAEVHFRRGEREQAIELTKRNLAQEPNNKHFQSQLQRFEQAKK